MKQLLLLLVISVFSTSLFAQLNKGQWLVGGSAGFSYENFKNNYLQYTASIKQTTVQLAPEIGYFIADKLALGIRGTASFSNDKDNYGGDSLYSELKSTGLGITPFVRYYFLPKANKINLLAEVSYTYNFVKMTNSYNLQSSTTKQHTHSYTFAAGPSFFLNPKVALEVTAAYTLLKNVTDFQTTNSLMLNVGLQIYLGGKKA